MVATKATQRQNWYLTQLYATILILLTHFVTTVEKHDRRTEKTFTLTV